MNHIPLPKAPFCDHVEVPYYVYDIEIYTYSPPWASYVACKGYTDGKLSLIAADGLPAIAKPAFASFVQSWLFFGVLRGFLNHDYLVEDWTRTTAAGDCVISTQQLCDRLQLWRDEVFASSEDGQHAECLRIDKLLNRMFSVHDKLSFKIRSGETAGSIAHLDLIPQELSLSIHVLHTTLMAIWNAVFLVNCLKIDSFGGDYAVINRRLSRNGWCPSEVGRLRQDSSILGEYYASCLGSQGISQDHSHCDDGTCFAAQINQDDYRPVHTDKDCGCMLVTLETASVAECLRHGLTPLLHLEKAETLRLYATSIQNKSESFVAISHVWADGLGNPKYNSLPLCQLRKIQRQFDEASSQYSDKSKSLFWMNTLCVPVGEAFKVERGLAIADMAAIYRSADFVLILNSEVDTIDSERRACEIAARVTRTPWFRRLWTLQKGILARPSLFQLADVAVEMSSLKRPFDEDRNTEYTIEPLLCGTILQEACRPLTKLQAFRNKSHSERVRDIWSAAQWRTTSWQDDETICLVNMLGLDLSPILAIDRNEAYACEKRIRAFILLQKRFTQTSIFEQTEMRSFREERGFRWAPPSFIFRHRITEKAEPSPSPLVPVDEAGIHVQYPGVLLDWSHLTFNDDRQLFFLLPKQWDYYYTVYWVETKLDISETLNVIQTGSTFPAIILKSNPSKRTEKAGLVSEPSH